MPFFSVCINSLCTGTLQIFHLSFNRLCSKEIEPRKTNFVRWNLQVKPNQVKVSHL